MLYDDEQAPVVFEIQFVDVRLAPVPQVLNHFYYEAFASIVEFGLNSFGVNCGQ